jgi:hypothetical protein
MDLKPTKLTAEEIQQLKDIAEKRMLPASWKLAIQSEVTGEGKERFRAWQPQLVLERADGTRFAHTIREHLLWPMTESGEAELLEEPDPAAIPKDWRPLSAAIESFNNGHRSLGKIDMPPVTEAEIVAAIRSWKTKRSEFDVTNSDFDRLQSIAKLRAVPPDAEFSIITHFQPGDGSEYLIWSLRLHLKKTSNDSPYPQFGEIFRTHFVRSTKMDDGKIAWGPVAKNGLQAGFRIEPSNERYAAGKSVSPRFYIRNTADMIKHAAFPRIMTRSYYEKLEVVDAAGAAIEVESDPDPTGPVGWLEMPFGFGAKHEISGLPILLGTGARGESESAIHAKSGQSVRMRFTLQNYGDRDGEKLLTEWISFTIE